MIFLNTKINIIFNAFIISVSLIQISNQVILYSRSLLISFTIKNFFKEAFAVSVVFDSSFEFKIVELKTLSSIEKLILEKYFSWQKSIVVAFKDDCKFDRWQSFKQTKSIEMFSKHFFRIDSRDVDLSSRITSLDDNDSNSALNDELRFFSRVSWRSRTTILSVIINNNCLKIIIDFIFILMHASHSIQAQLFRIRTRRFLLFENDEMLR